MGRVLFWRSNTNAKKEIVLRGYHIPISAAYRRPKPSSLVGALSLAEAGEIQAAGSIAQLFSEGILYCHQATFVLVLRCRS